MSSSTFSLYRTYFSERKDPILGMPSVSLQNFVSAGLSSDPIATCCTPRTLKGLAVNRLISAALHIDYYKPLRSAWT